MIKPIETDKYGNANHGAVIRAINRLIQENNLMIHWCGDKNSAFISEIFDPNVNEKGEVAPCVYPPKT